MDSEQLSELLSLPQIDMDNRLKVDRATAHELYEICQRDCSSWTMRERELIDQQIQMYSPNQYSEAEYGADYYVLKPNQIEIDAGTKASNTVADINTSWDSKKFNAPRAPFVIGSVIDIEKFETPGSMRCLHLPIKLPGSELRVPIEYRHLSEALQRILDFESAVNPDYHEYHAYLTLDQRFVPGGNVQRLPGAHVDGLPRDRANPGAQRIDHSYIVTNNLATRFFVHPFPMDRYDLNKHNFFAIMRHFADEKQSILTNPFEISLMNAYSVHTSIPAEWHCYRTFMRLEFSVLQFDRRGNAVNPHFDYRWNYRQCAIPEHLALPDDILSSLRQ